MHMSGVWGLGFRVWGLGFGVGLGSFPREGRQMGVSENRGTRI